MYILHLQPVKDLLLLSPKLLIFLFFGPFIKCSFFSYTSPIFLFILCIMPRAGFLQIRTNVFSWDHTKGSKSVTSFVICRHKRLANLLYVNFIQLFLVDVANSHIVQTLLRHKRSEPHPKPSQGTKTSLRFCWGAWNNKEEAWPTLLPVRINYGPLAA